MPWFKCFIHGKNFPGVILGQATPIGFYTTRFVEAHDAQQAEFLVLDTLKKDPHLRLPKGFVLTKEARVYFESITEVNSEEVPEYDGGYSFYYTGAE